MRRIPAAVTAVSALTVGASATAAVPALAGPSATGRSRPAVRGGFTQHVLTAGLGDPYEIEWGPDGSVWATEKSGRRITRINPRTGTKSTTLSLPQAVHSGQDGVLGLAFHPDLLEATGHDYVYLSYTYQTTTPAAVTRETRRTRIVRYVYDAANHRLRDPKDVITGLPGGTDHQSGRLRFGPDAKLYYTIGDQGADKGAHACNPNWAQRLPTAAEVRAGNWAAYQGKTLRLNLDGSIPADNPTLNGVRSHVWTYGHRNGQGLTFAPNGTLYEGEQGPKTDDEINILRKGGNYGWPYVAGYRDDNAYTYDNWSASAPTPCARLTYSDLSTPPSVPGQRETEWRGAFVPPVRTFGTVDNGFDFADPRCATGRRYFMCWPTLANSSLEYYRPTDGSGIPGWTDSLLMTTLKDGAIYRLRLTANGSRVAGVAKLWTDQNRYRDTAFSPDGRAIFVATDSAGPVRDTTGGATFHLKNPGSILVLQWHE